MRTLGFSIISIFLLLSYTGCTSDSLSEINSEEDRLEDLPVVDLDYSIPVKYGMHAFESPEQFVSILDESQKVENQESILNWTKSLSVNTLYGTIEGISSSNSLNEDSELSSLFKSVDPISGEIVPSQEVMAMTYLFQSPEGFLIMGEKIGFFSSSLQVWAKLEQKDELRSAILEGVANSLEEYDVIYDYRTTSWLSALGSRGNDLVNAPVCPWVAGSGTQWSAEHVNVNNGSTRRCKSQWRHEQMTMGSFPNKIVKQTLSCWAFSYKKTFGYKTDHYFRFRIRFSTNSPGNPQSTSTGSYTIRGKRFAKIHTYNEVTGIENITEQQEASAQILDFPLQGTKHSHRGMGGEWNILQCP